MPVEKSFEKFLVAKRRKLTTEQVVVECSVNLESGEELAKVLSVKACSNLDSPTVTSNEINFNGKLTLNIIYLTADNLVGSQRNVCPFTFKTAQETTGTVYGKAKVIETTVENATTTNIKVLCVVEVCVFEIKNEELKMISSAGEDVMTRESELTLVELSATSTQQFVEENTFTTKEQVKSVLSSHSTVVVKDCNAGYNFVSMQGDIITRLIYTVDDGREKISSTYVINSFKQELEIEGVTKEDKIEVLASVLCDGVTTTINNGEGETAIVVSVPVEATVFAFATKTTTTITDLYSVKNDVQTVTESYEFTNLAECDYFESKIEGTLTLSDETPRVDKLLAVTGEGFIDSTAYVNENEISVEGVCYANLVYLNDETGSVNSVQIEFPFVVNEKSSHNGAEVSIKISLTDVDAMVKKGRDVYFDAKLKMEVCYYTEEKGGVITDITVGEELATRVHPIEIYFAHQGESLWDIAKQLKVKDSLIFEQNANLTDPLEKDEKIVLYFQKNAK